MKVLPLYLPHQGCTHQCVYCNQPLTVGVTDDRQFWQSRLQSNSLQTKHSEWEIAFYSGTFTALSKNKMDECFLFASQALQCSSVKGFRVSTRPDRVSGSILNYLKDNGVTTIELGVESLDDSVLRKSARGHTASDVRDACKRIQQNEFQLGIHLMCGLSGQSEFSWKETVHETLEIKPDCVRIAPTIVLKDTPLAKLYARGDYVPLTLSGAVQQTSYAYQRFVYHNIPVIRVGLALSDEQGCGEDKIVAGPWHPALRHEVESKLALSSISNELNASQSQEVRINPKDVSIVVGAKKCNLQKWKQAGFDVKIKQCGTIPRHKFTIGSDKPQLLFGVPKDCQ